MLKCYNKSYDIQCVVKHCVAIKIVVIVYVYCVNCGDKDASICPILAFDSFDTLPNLGQYYMDNPKP